MHKRNKRSESREEKERELNKQRDSLFRLIIAIVEKKAMTSAIPCSALPIELSSQLGAGHCVNSLYPR